MLDTVGIIGNQQGRDYLISLLPDVGPGFRMQILNLLSAIGDEPSMEAIAKRLYDSSPDVRALANRLIESSTDLLNSAAK
jgi:HEAT repeat protein